MCVRKLKHFQPHSLLCHLWCLLFAIRSFLCDIYVDMIILKSWRSSFDKLFFFIIYNFFHIANQLYQHSSTSRTIASSQHHPRETRPLLSQPNLYKNRYIGIAYYEFVSYIARNESMLLLILFSPFSYFFSSTSYIIRKTVNVYADSFSFLSFPLTSYYIWKWVNEFADPFFCI